MTNDATHLCSTATNLRPCGTGIAVCWFCSVHLRGDDQHFGCDLPRGGRYGGVFTVVVCGACARPGEQAGQQDLFGGAS